MNILKNIKPACILIAFFIFLLSPAVSAGEPIKIGAMFISSGKMGGYGTHGRQAIELAIEQINADGGAWDATWKQLLKTQSSKKM